MAHPRAPPAPTPWQPGGSGWTRGYTPPPPQCPPPSSFQDPRAAVQYPLFPDPYGGFDPFSRMAPGPDQSTFPLFRYVIVDILYRLTLVVLQVTCYRRD